MTDTRLQTHVSIDTPHLAASVAFYRAMLGAEPSLERRDYARFDVGAPPLVLALNAVEGSAPGSTGALEHLGIRYGDDAQLDRARERLSQLGVPLQEEPDAVCCYARLARIWIRDPSLVRWELFIAREAVVAAPSRAGDASSCCAAAGCASIAG